MESRSRFDITTLWNYIFKTIILKSIYFLVYYINEIWFSYFLISFLNYKGSEISTCIHWNPLTTYCLYSLKWLLISLYCIVSCFQFKILQAICFSFQINKILKFRDEELMRLLILKTSKNIIRMLKCINPGSENKEYNLKNENINSIFIAIFN